MLPFPQLTPSPQVLAVAFTHNLEVDPVEMEAMDSIEEVIMDQAVIIPMAEAAEVPVLMAEAGNGTFLVDPVDLTPM